MESNLYYAWTRPIVALSVYFSACHLGLVWWENGACSYPGWGFSWPVIRYTERFANPVLIIAWEVHIIQRLLPMPKDCRFLAHKTKNEIFDGDGHIRTDAT